MFEETHPPAMDAAMAAAKRQRMGEGMPAFKTYRPPIRNSSRGQAMVEYVIIAGLLMAALGIMTVFFVTFKEYGGRVLALVSSEYP